MIPVLRSQSRLLITLKDYSPPSLQPLHAGCTAAKYGLCGTLMMRHLSGVVRVLVGEARAGS